MSSHFLESIGLGGLDIAFVLIGMMVFILVLLVLIIIQFNKLNKLQKKYAKFMKGKEAKSLEEEIIGLYDDNDYIKKESDKNRKEIKEIQKRMEYCYGMAEEVFIEYMSQNGITDAAAHMIVLDRIRDTNPQLILNLIAENVILTGRRKDF